jgi:prepilin-type N-terminal cleavage/methylation domain-containing protein
MERRDLNDQGATMKHPRVSEAGFSLIELLVAMTITLIVSGAIYGLMTAGQNAFRREPELAERQQNIRLAMDLMTRDIANAGSGLPPLAQVFTMGLDGAGVVGPSGFASDDIQLLAVAGRDSEPVCEAAGNGAYSEISLYRQGVDNIPLQTLMFLVSSQAVPTTTAAPEAQDDYWVARRLTGFEERADAPVGLTWELCSGTGTAMHTVLHFENTDPFNPNTLCANAAASPAGNYPGTCGTSRITRAVFGKQVTYQIRPDADGVPVLQRISTEDPTLTPQVIARGIEELQVQYTQFTDPTDWLDGAPPVTAPINAALNDTAVQDAFGTMVNQLRLTLTSRSEARELQGAVTDAANNEERVRGSLTWTVSPRAALLGVARGRYLPPSPSPPIDWYWE